MCRRAYLIGGLSLAAVVAGAVSVNAQLVTNKDLSLAMATTIAQTAIQTCKAQGYAVSAHVLGRNGEVLVSMRGDDTAPHTWKIPSRKPTPRARSAFRPANSPRT